MFLQGPSCFFSLQSSLLMHTSNEFLAVSPPSLFPCSLIQMHSQNLPQSFSHKPLLTHTYTHTLHTPLVSCIQSPLAQFPFHATSLTCILKLSHKALTYLMYTLQQQQSYFLSFSLISFRQNPPLSFSLIFSPPFSCTQHLSLPVPLACSTQSHLLSPIHRYRALTPSHCMHTKSLSLSFSLSDSPFCLLPCSHTRVLTHAHAVSLTSLAPLFQNP